MCSLHRSLQKQIKLLKSFQVRTLQSYPFSPGPAYNWWQLLPLKWTRGPSLLPGETGRSRWAREKFYLDIGDSGSVQSRENPASLFPFLFPRGLKLPLFSVFRVNHIYELFLTCLPQAHRKVIPERVFCKAVSFYRFVTLSWGNIPHVEMWSVRRVDF